MSAGKFGKEMSRHGGAIRILSKEILGSMVQKLNEEKMEEEIGCNLVSESNYSKKRALHKKSKEIHNEI